MDKMVERLGKIISDNVTERPDRASWLLRTAYRAVGTAAKHFPSLKFTSSREYLQAYTAGLLADMLKDPSSSAVVNIFMPAEIFHALGMPIMAPEALATYVVNTASERVFIERSEDNGAPETFCSFHKVLLGMAESGVLKKPAMIASTTLACDANQLTFRRLADIWDVPHTVIDVPFNIDDEAVAYVADSLRKMVPMAEEAAKRRLDMDELKLCVERSRLQLENFDRYLTLRKDIHLGESFTPEMLNIACNHLYPGTVEGLRYSELLLKDAKEAKSRGSEKRIMWMHVLPNWQNSVMDIFQGMDNSRAEVVACDLACSSLMKMDPEKPFESMARRLVYDSFNGPGRRRIESALAIAKRLEADGVVIFCQWGCKQTQGLAYTAREIFTEHGIPSVVLDGDGCDRSNGGGEQIITRARAFIEQLEQR